MENISPGKKPTPRKKIAIEIVMFILGIAAVLLVIFVYALVLRNYKNSPTTGPDTSKSIQVYRRRYDSLTYLIFIHPTGNFQVINYTRDSLEWEHYRDDQYMLADSTK